jgi:hypothetical protein
MLLFSHNEVILTYADTETGLIYVPDVFARYPMLRNSLYKLIEVLFGSYKVLGVLTLSIELLVEYLTKAESSNKARSPVYSN